MSATNHPAGTVRHRRPGRRDRSALAGAGVLCLSAGVGLWLVKWNPSLHTGFQVASGHRVGTSIVSGGTARAPSGWHAALDYAHHYGLSIWPALVVGLLLAAGVAELLPHGWLARVVGSDRFHSTALGGLAAVPSMMCTCCAAPVAVSLARGRASVGAALAYWLGSPVLNPATVVFLGFVLGWRWALLRIVVGAALVLGVATGAQRLFGARCHDATAPPTTEAPTSTDTPPATAPMRPGPVRRPMPLRYLATLCRLALTLLPEYALVVLALGAARGLLFPAVSPSIGHTGWLVAVLALTGTLFVVPTAGEIPIVASLLGFGLGAAGGAALLVTLPAVSLPSLVMLARAVPARVLAFVAGSVAACGLLAAALSVAMRL